MRSYPVQAEDEDDPAPIPPWDEARYRCQSSRRRSPSRRQRALAWAMLGLGFVGVALGIFFPGTGTEVVLGGLLVIFGLRSLTATPDRGESRRD